METDTELIARRRAEDRRIFLIKALDPANAPRMAGALRAVRDALGVGGWRPYDAVLAAGVRASDITVKTVDNQIRASIAVGMVDRRGEYRRWYDRRAGQWNVTDTRELRVIDWPVEL